MYSGYSAFGIVLRKLILGIPYGECIRLQNSK